MADHVLVYQIGSLGDTIVSIPAYRAVRRHFGPTKVRLLEAKLAEGRVMPSDMLKREGLIDGVTNYPLSAGGGGLGAKLKLLRTVRASKPSTVVYIGPAERPPDVVKRDKLFFKLCGARELIGFHGIDYTEFSQRDSNGWLPKMPHQSKMRLDRLAKDGIQTREEDLALPLLRPTIEEKEAALDWLDKHRKHPERKLVTMGIKTAKPLTQWPLDRFAELGKRLSDSGVAEVVVTGGPGDRETAESLVAAWGSGAVAAGHFGIHDMGALLSLSDLYIGLDTGTTHLAAAVDARILALYADHAQPGEWDPMGSRTSLLLNRVPCGGCRGFDCKTEGHPCMNQFTADSVFNRAYELLAQPS